MGDGTGLRGGLTIHTNTSIKIRMSRDQLMTCQICSKALIVPYVYAVISSNVFVVLTYSSASGIVCIHFAENVFLNRSETQWFDMCLVHATLCSQLLYASYLQRSPRSMLVASAPGSRSPFIVVLCVTVCSLRPRPRFLSFLLYVLSFQARWEKIGTIMRLQSPLR